jgi:hypothetical protein
MDVGVYDQKMNSGFLDHHYFKPLVYSPVKEKEEFQVNLRDIVVYNKDLLSLLLNVLLVVFIIYMLMLVTGNNKCLKKMSLKKIL